MESSVNKDLLRSRVDTFVLNSLSEKDGYGYDILRYIEEKTQGHYNMKQSSIYSVLKRLEKQGLIKSYIGDESQGSPRRYYSLTDKGKGLLEQEQQQWMYTRTLLDSLVSDQPFDLEEDTPPFQPSELRPLTKRTNRAETANDVNSQVQNKVEEKTSVQYINEFAKLKQSNEQAELDKLAPQHAQANQKARQTLFSSDNATKIVPKPQIQKEKGINPEYKNIFGDIYKSQPNVTSYNKPKQIPTYKDEEIDCHHINDLRNVLRNEGHSLKPYRKDELLGMAKKDLIYSNRLFMDTSLLTFLFYILSVLIIYRYRVEFSYSPKTLLAVGLSGLIIPLIGFAKFLTDPKMRQRAVFNFKIAFSYSVMVFLLVFVINLIVCLVTPSIDITVKDAKMYPPVIFALFIPVSVIFYQLLYNSSVYRVKS